MKKNTPENILNHFEQNITPNIIKITDENISKILASLAIDTRDTDSLLSPEEKISIQGVETTTKQLTPRQKKHFKNTRKEIKSVLLTEKDIQQGNRNNEELEIEAETYESIEKNIQKMLEKLAPHIKNNQALLSLQKRFETLDSEIFDKYNRNSQVLTDFSNLEGDIISAYQKLNKQQAN